MYATKLGVLAGGLTAAAVAFSAGAGTALAPEPARLATVLSGSTGATAAAVFVNSSAPTRVLYYSSSWVVGGSSGPAAGTPCSSMALPADPTTTQVIQAFTSGAYTYRRCA
jgi:hypothetical protein